MPFTLSHPSAALAIWSLVRRGYIPLAPFAIGAMAPDVEYLLRLEPYALVSHSVWGVLIFCLPVGVLAYLLWEWLLRPVSRILVALPLTGASRSWGRGSLARVTAALLVGSVSHVMWDAVTHRDAWGPALLPALRSVAFAVGDYAVPWYNVLQLGSSLVGGLVVLAWLKREVEARGEGLRALVTPWRLRAWSALGVVAVAVAVWNGPREGMMTGIAPLKLYLGRVAVGALVGALLALVTLAVLHRMGVVTMNETGREPRA